MLDVVANKSRHPFDITKGDSISPLGEGHVPVRSKISRRISGGMRSNVITLIKVLQVISLFRFFGIIPDRRRFDPHTLNPLAGIYVLFRYFILIMDIDNFPKNVLQGILTRSGSWRIGRRQRTIISPVLVCKRWRDELWRDDIAIAEMLLSSKGLSKKALLAASSVMKWGRIPSVDVVSALLDNHEVNY